MGFPINVVQLTIAQNTPLLSWWHGTVRQTDGQMDRSYCCSVSHFSRGGILSQTMIRPVY